MPGYRAIVKACPKLYLTSPRVLSTRGGTVPRELTACCLLRAREAPGAYTNEVWLGGAVRRGPVTLN